MRKHISLRRCHRSTEAVLKNGRIIQKISTFPENGSEKFWCRVNYEIWSEFKAARRFSPIFFSYFFVFFLARNYKVNFTFSLKWFCEAFGFQKVYITSKLLRIKNLIELFFKVQKNWVWTLSFELEEIKCF